MANLKKWIIGIIKRRRLLNFVYDFYKYKTYIKLVDPKKDTWYFDFFNYASGDVYMGASLIKAFKKKYNDDKVTVIVHNPKFIDIVKYFETDVEIKVISAPLPLFKSFTIFKKGVIIDLHPIPCLKHVTNILGYKNITLFDLFKVLYTLPFSTIPDYPTNGHVNGVSYVEELFTRLKLEKGNTLIIAPEAVTIKEIDISFWKELIRRMKPYNKDIVLMALSSAYDTLNLPKISFPYQYAIAAVNYAGYIISVRSGFCDIISTSDAIKIIIYPHMVWGGGTFIQGATITQLNPKGNDKLYELEYVDNDGLINKIVKTFENNG